MTIQRLPDAIPFGSNGLDGWLRASTLAATTRATTTLMMIANPPVWGVGLEWSVRSLGWASIEPNDFCEDNLLVIIKADTKATTAGKMTIMMFMVKVLPDPIIYIYPMCSTSRTLRFSVERNQLRNCFSKGMHRLVA